MGTYSGPISGFGLVAPSRARRVALPRPIASVPLFFPCPFITPCPCYRLTPKFRQPLNSKSASGASFPFFFFSPTPKVAHPLLLLRCPLTFLNPAGNCIARFLMVPLPAPSCRGCRYWGLVSKFSLPSKCFLHLILFFFLPVPLAGIRMSLGMAPLRLPRRLLRLLSGTLRLEVLVPLFALFLGESRLLEET